MDSAEPALVGTDIHRLFRQTPSRVTVLVNLIDRFGLLVGTDRYLLVRSCSVQISVDHREQINNPVVINQSVLY